MVQSLNIRTIEDPCNKTETRDNINNAAKNRTVYQNQTVIVDCATNAVQIVATKLIQNGLSQLNLPVATENPVTSSILKTTFQNVSTECKNFTLAMSLKHQLQNYLFTQNNSDLTSDQISQLSSILIYLQTVANSLDNIHSRRQTSHCVRLSAHGYRMIYHVLYETTSLLTEIKEQGITWVRN